ncbi:MAG: nucleotidyl transferase AbiEii/AbiGii toxin family protein [Ignavibacteria bacterium]|nr:nucleotidyl transferase AbiEii/AbiGii toxin family protein [Ignavibacteria bacterium]
MSPNKNKPVTNIGASVRAQLLNIAKKSSQDYNRVLIRYAQERLLYRFSVSHYRGNFILKGALLFLTYDMPDYRPTKDIDFLGHGVTSEIDGIKSVIEEVTAIVVEDGVTFDHSTIVVEPIAEQTEYGGLRVSIRCSVGGARNVLQVDVGFGDRITAGPLDVDFPTMLDFPAPNISVYSLESAIAEKFEAIVRLNIATSRMKDFYDLVHLAKHQALGAGTLAEAIRLTFSTRGTPLPDREMIFSDAFMSDNTKDTQWTAFHRTNKLTPVGSFRDAIGLIEQFLGPILLDPKPYLRWQPDLFRWQMRERNGT